MQPSTALVIQKSSGVYFEKCNASATPCGVKIVNDGTKTQKDNAVRDCIFSNILEYTVFTVGSIESLALVGNTTDLNINRLQAEISSFENSKNSWN